MDNFRNYLFKNIKLTDVDDDVFTGRVEVTETAYDNDDTEDSITVCAKERDNQLIEFMSSEVKSIEIIDKSN